ncbi:MAG: ribosomal protein S18-alanine N-acetyltransferase [Sulfolobales archaeon]|nr:ribosomal protein S18-alanine N-acetyltransferase [Sulfolobales archaeon]MCX8208284.1 ribosomal protein S18-alanine N-acetyltransferase [Sulfolobales archaeon]MDW8010124.1 ribosomal protein S18-alanine N-acetyltransferase [Sulfolobales archaeon]
MEKVEYVVRPIASEDELKKVIEINAVTLPEHYPYFFWLEHYELWRDIFLVALAGERIVGYNMCRIEYGVGHVKRGIVKQGHVVSIAVLPEFRQRGIATALMTSAMNSMKKKYGADEVYLEVRVSNEPAIRLYEKLGFKKVRVLKRYYLDGEDAYLMAREL